MRRVIGILIISSLIAPAAWADSTTLTIKDGADYLAQAARYGRIPAAYVPTEAYLDPNHPKAS